MYSFMLFGGLGLEASSLYSSCAGEMVLQIFDEEENLSRRLYICVQVVIGKPWSDVVRIVG